MRYVTTSLLLFIASFLFGQGQNPTNEQLSGLEEPIVLIHSGQQARTGGQIDDWYRWFVDFPAYEGGFNQQPYFFTLYPDTFLKRLYVDENTSKPKTEYVTWCSVGQGFDPISPIWLDKDLLEIENYAGYFLDSVGIRYGYFRNNPDTSVVDTLIVQVFRSTRFELTLTDKDPDIGHLALPKVDHQTGRGMGFMREIKVPLTAKDSIVPLRSGAFMIKTLRVPLADSGGVWLSKNQVAHVTVSFKPGQSYSMNDTLYFDPDLKSLNVDEPVNKLNRFGVIVAVQTPNTSKLNSYNNGSFVNKWNRYRDTTHNDSFPEGHYFTNHFSDGTQSTAYYPQIMFKITAALSVGTEGENPSRQILVFPNPSNETVHVQMTALKDEKASLQIVDASGRAVYESMGSAGRWQVQTSGFEPGMYIVHVQTLSGSYTRRLMVK